MKRLIIDTNAICCVLAIDRNDLKVLREAVLFGQRYQVCVLIGGQLAREYAVLRRYSGTFAELRRSGRLITERDTDVDNEQQVLEANRGLRSDDAHIIALARIGRVRILCSFDGDLQKDFKNKRLIDSPRGRIYLGSKHNHLLR